MPATARTTTQSAKLNQPSTLDGVELIAFDVDNTLVDILQTKRDTFAATLETLAERGLAIDAEAQARELYAFALEEGIDEPDVVPRFLAEELDVDGERMLADGRRTMERLEPGMVQLYDGVISTLDQLRSRGYQLCAVTDAPREAVRRRLPPNGLTGRFDRVIVREDTPRGKADTRPFEMLLEAVDARPEQLVAIGDHPVRDVSNVVAMGGHGVLAEHGTRSSYNDVAAEHEPTATIDGVEELLALLPGCDQRSSALASLTR
jgi:HAD superfamily hydrolase (TIGR01509 family)